MAKVCQATVKVAGDTIMAVVQAQNTGNTTLNLTLECSLVSPSGVESGYKSGSSPNVPPQGHTIQGTFIWDVDNTFTEAGTWKVYARLYNDANQNKLSEEFCPFTIQGGTTNGRIVGADIQPRSPLPLVAEGTTITASCAAENNGTAAGDLMIGIQFFRADGTSIKSQTTKTFTAVPSDGTTSTYSVSYVASNATLNYGIYAVYTVYSKVAGAWKTTADDTYTSQIMQIAKAGMPECYAETYSTNPIGDTVYKGQTLTAEARIANNGMAAGYVNIEIVYLDDNNNMLKSSKSIGADLPIGGTQYLRDDYVVPSGYSTTNIHVYFIGGHEEGGLVVDDFRYVKTLRVV